MTIKLASMCAAAALFAAHLAQAADLTVTIENVRSPEGNVMLALYGSKANFLSRQDQGLMIAADKRTNNDSVTLVFKNLPKGRYALSSFHDLNGNGQLDTNLYGIPSEPYGFSGQASKHFGPPSFDDAAFDVNDSMSVKVRLQ